MARDYSGKSTPLVGRHLAAQHAPSVVLDDEHEADATTLIDSRRLREQDASASDLRDERSLDPWEAKSSTMRDPGDPRSMREPGSKNGAAEDFSDASDRYADADSFDTGDSRGKREKSGSSNSPSSYSSRGLYEGSKDNPYRSRDTRRRRSSRGSGDTDEFLKAGGYRSERDETNPYRASSSRGTRRGRGARSAGDTDEFLEAREASNSFNPYDANSSQSTRSSYNPYRSRDSRRGRSSRNARSVGDTGDYLDANDSNSRGSRSASRRENRRTPSHASPRQDQPSRITSLIDHLPSSQPSYRGAHSRPATQRRSSQSAARFEREGELAEGTTSAVAKPSSYVPALDGLRAFAVIAVVLYHLKSAWAPCGLLGVTMFFVLSGYLITGLLIAEWKKRRSIDLKLFWIKRIRRIMPAIGFLLVCLLILCAIFSPIMLTKLRNDFFPSLFFYNNWWQIFQNVSYFENLGSPSPVTHLWSLAIEEQFYILWPLLLIALFKAKVSKRPTMLFIGVLIALSATEMALLYVPGGDPSRVYYGTDTRAFSLLIGALLAFGFPIAKVKAKDFHRRYGILAEIVAVASLAGIAIMVFTVSAYEPFLYRGGFVLVSALTAASMVALINPYGLLSRFFSLAPWVWLGKRSYGLYLWHYPLLLLMNPPTNFAETPWYGYLFQVGVILAVTEFSYHFIEEPARKGAIGRALSSLRQRDFLPTTLFRRYPAYASVGAGLVVAALVCWIVVPPTQVIANTAAYEQTEPTDPAQAMEQQGSEEGQESEGQGAEGQGEAQAQENQTSAQSATGANAMLAGLPSNTSQWNVLWVGDSVSVVAQEAFENYFIHGNIDARSNRDLVEGLEVMSSWMDEGWHGDAVVLALGANTATSAEDFKAQYQAILDTIPDDVPVFAVNIRTPGIMNFPNNDIIAEIADTEDRVFLVDWYGASADHSDWFESDGTHLIYPTGADNYIKTINSQLVDYQKAAQSSSATTASGTTANQ